MTAGPDGLPSFFIKDCSNVFATPLLSIFNLALSSSTWPKCWHLSRVCPVLKKGNSTYLKNYRPVSIIDNFAKVFEMSVYAKVFPLIKNSINQAQHGFVQGRSTVTNLATFSQYCSDIVDKGGQVDVVYTDFSRAFDRISHPVTLQKLLNVGFDQSLCKFFESYLMKREYFVAYGGFRSEPYVALSGVPQGSNLGPLIFLLFINDIVDDIDCGVLLYADDLKVFTSVQSIYDCQYLQRQLGSVRDWCVQNKLDLNISKCRVLTFTRKKNPVVYPYEINEITVDRVSEIRDLGVIFDDQLSFRRHVEEVVGASMKMLGFIIRNTSAFSDTKTITTLYYTLVRSKLEYASTVWNPIYDVHKIALERVQRKLLKYLHFKSSGVYPVRGYDNTLLLREFNMQSLECRRLLHSLAFLYKMVHNQLCCPKLLPLIEICTPREGSRTCYMFKCPRAVTNIFVKSPIYTMVNTYNKFSKYCNIFDCTIKELLQAAVVHLHLV